MFVDLIWPMSSLSQEAITMQGFPASMFFSRFSDPCHCPADTECDTISIFVSSRLASSVSPATSAR